MSWKLGLRNRYSMCALIGALLSVALGTPVRAHPQSALTTVNRYAKLVVTGGRARIFYTLMVGEVPALALRSEADRDGTGGLNPAEQEALALRLRERIIEGVSLRRNGTQPVSLQWESPVFTAGDSQPGTAAFSIDIAAHSLPLKQTPLELVYEDRVELSPSGEVELRIEESPDAQLLASRLASSPASSAPPTLLFQRTPSAVISSPESSVFLQYSQAETQSVAESAKRSVAVVGFIASLCLLVAGIGSWRTFRRKRSPLR